MVPTFATALFSGMPLARTLHEPPVPLSALMTGADAEVPALPSGPVIAELPRAACLARQIEVPAAASGQLGRIAALDLVRRTPFRTDEVYWALGPVERQGDRLKVTQWVVRKTDVDRLAQRLAARGAQLVGLRVAGGATTPALIATLAGSRAGRGLRRLNLAAAIVGLAALATVWLGSTWQQSSALPALRAALDADLTDATALRAGIEEMRAQSDARNAFLSAMVHRPRLSVTLRDLTVALPDEVWLSDVTWSATSVVLTGETRRSAADLVLSLGDLRGYRNPRMSGAVSRSIDGGERFEIALDHRQPP